MQRARAEAYYAERRNVIDEALRGRSYRAAAEWLNMVGVPTRTGARWSLANLHRFLTVLGHIAPRRV